MYGPETTDSKSETFQKVREIRDTTVEKNLYSQSKNIFIKLHSE